jgi:hypothetical protein
LYQPDEVLLRLSPFLKRIPFCAAFPIPTINAVGVANPSAHGQAIINTATKLIRATLKLFGSINNHTNEKLL